MVEVAIRLCVALLFVAVGWLGAAPFDLTWKLAAAVGALSFLNWRFEIRGLKNSGVAGFFAIGDSFALAMFLASANVAPQLGFLVLVPCALAAARFGSPMISMAPLAASSLVAADGMFSRSGIPSPLLLLHAACVLGFSMVLGHRRAQAEPMPAREPLLHLEPRPQLIEDGLIHLRENYRKLRDAYRDLERRSRLDKVAARIGRAREADHFYGELCAALKELSRAGEMAIYTLARFEQIMVVRGTSEDFPRELGAHSVHVDLAKAPAIVPRAGRAGNRSGRRAGVALQCPLDSSGSDDWHGLCPRRPPFQVGSGSQRSRGMRCRCGCRDI